MIHAGPARRARVLFLAWGPSIHARRRIEIFTRDPAFEVCVVSPHDFGFSGAVNVRLADTGLKDLSPLGSPDGLADQLLARGRRWAYLGRKAVKQLGAHSRDLSTLKLAVRDFNPDVIFLQTLLYPSYLALLLPDNRPVMVTFWNGDVTWWARTTGLEMLLKKQIVTRGARRARAITVNSMAALEACLAYGVATSKVHLIRYPGVDLVRFSAKATKEEAKEDLRLGDRRVVLCPRGIGGYLNSDVVLRSAKEVARKFPEVVFLFVSGAGAAAELERHRDWVRNAGLEENFRWDGQVPWERMSTYYRSADAVVSVSSNDSLPNCMLEAMACEVPVIMGDIPSIREWVAHEENGLLVPPRDPMALTNSILRILADPGGLARRFAENNLPRLREEADVNAVSVRVKTLVQDTIRDYRNEFERR